MTLKQFFESRLKFDRGATYEIEGIRGYLAQELVKAQTGYDILRATLAADQYLVGVLQEEASRIYTMSIP
jgi:hypothetical protein